MRKFLSVISVLLLCISISITANGKAVNESTAKIIGAHHLIKMGVPGVNNENDLKTVYVATAQVNGNLITDYYVFNIENGTGFVMVTGDDIVVPILAYSKESDFELGNMSPATRRWIDGYKNEITYVIEHNVPGQPGTKEKWDELKQAFQTGAARTTAVTPLVTTKWDQGSLYNYMCPTGPGGQAVTGCVATAMAQIMKYHNWPTVGTGFHSYSHATYGTLSADFGNTSYQWTNMPNWINTASKVAIGTLMLHCGIAVNMDYSPVESGAYVVSAQSPIVHCAEYALKAFFHYKPSLKGVVRNPTYTAATWIALLKTEMDAHRPVLYSGSSVTAGGHAWVCDGYDATNYMHFNFGWGGASDGYYYVDNVAPPALGIGGGGGDFNSNQKAIIGIQPDVFPTSSDNIKMISHLTTTTQSPVSYGGGFMVKGKIVNNSGSAFSGEICAQAFDASGNYVGTLQTYTGQNIANNDSSASLTFTTPPSLEYCPARYGISLMYRPTGSSTWKAVGNNGNLINYNMIDIVNGSSIILADSLHIGNHTILRGSPLTVNTKLASTYGTFGGSVQAILINISTTTSYPIQLFTSQVITVATAQAYTFTTTGLTAPAGEYVLAIQHKIGTSGGMNYTGSELYQNPVRVTIVPPADVKNPSLNDAGISVYPNPANDVINIDLKGVDVSAIRIMDLQGRELKTLIPVKNQSVVTVPVDGFAQGLYFVQLQSGTEVVTKKIVIAK